MCYVAWGSSKPHSTYFFHSFGFFGFFVFVFVFWFYWIFAGAGWAGWLGWLTWQGCVEEEVCAMWLEMAQAT